MKISTAICSVIAIALLSGCSTNTSSLSGSSLVAPATSSGVANSRFIPAAASAKGVDRFGRVHDARNLPLSACHVAYVSAPSPTAEDLLYTVPPSGQPTSFPVYGPLPNLPPRDNGWGLWAEHKPQLILAGHSGSPDRIDVYNPCMTARVASYKTASHGPPESIAAFNGFTLGPPNAVFATEYQQYVIDCGSGPLLGTCSDSNLLGYPQYVAVDDASHVYVQGWDSGGAHDEVDQCTWTSPTLTGCTTCALITGGNPGGMAVDKDQHLIVNDQGTRTLYVYNTSTCSSTNTPISTPLPYSPCFVTYVCIATAITLDRAEDEIVGEYYYWWSGDSSCPSISKPCMQASEVGYDWSTGNFGLSSAAATPFISNQVSGTGIAVWPPGAY
jgi:hypothetical protein